MLLGLFRRGADLDAAGLAAATDVDLGLYRDRLADLGGNAGNLLGRVGHPAGRKRDPRVAEQLLGLVFMNDHLVLLGIARGAR